MIAISNKDMSTIVTKQKYLNFDKKNFAEIYTNFNFRIIDGHIEFPYCMLLFDKSNNIYDNRSIKLETAVT